MIEQRQLDVTLVGRLRIKLHRPLRALLADINRQHNLRHAKPWPFPNSPVRSLNHAIAAALTNELQRQ